MPALAVPYLLPFAEAAGIAIAGLGLMEISKQVQKFMDINPEETFKILTLLAPAQGIMALFNKEAGDDEVTEEIEVEEKPKSKKSKKEIVLEELAKEKGSYASPEAEGSWASPRGRIIRRLKEEGKITDKPDPNYDPDKKYKGYKRFTRGRKADGGRIGFVVGGLSEQDQSIYDAWLRAGHSKEDVMAFLASRGLDSTDTGIESIVNVQPNIIDQGGGGGGGPLGTQISDFRTSVNPDDIDDTEIKQPGKFKTFIDSGINKLRESKLGQMAGSALGFLGDLPGAGIVTGMVDKMDRFDELPAGDQKFITSMMGYSDPDTNRGNVDPFGINTRSLFGNYADYVRKTNQKLAGREFKPGSWQAQRQQFYNIQENERIRQEKEAAERQEALLNQVRAQAAANQIAGDRGGWQSGLARNEGFMTDVAEMGSFKKGGLATMFARRK